MSEHLLDEDGASQLAIVDDAPEPATSSVARQATGLLCVSIAVILWTTASYITQALVVPSSSATPASLSPVCVSCIASASLLAFVPAGLYHLFSRVASSHQQGGLFHCDQNGKSNCTEGLFPSASSSQLEAAAPATRHGFVAVVRCLRASAEVRAALAASGLWFGALLLGNLSLALTSVGSNILLSSPASLLTFVLSIFLLGESVNKGKVFSICLCVLGTILVAFVDSVEGPALHNGPALLGDIFALLGTALFASYSVVLRCTFKPDEPWSKSLFFGCLGLINVLVYAPIALFLFRFQDFWHPEGSTVSMWAVVVVVVKSMFDVVLCEYFWAHGVVIVGPTIATVMSALTAPAALSIDAVLGKATWDRNVGSILAMLSGTACVLTSIVSFEIADRRQPVT